MEISNINLDIFKGETFCRAACWFDINTLATASDKRIIWLGKAIDLKVGQLATSVKLLADRWNMTAQTARNRLKEFADAGLIALDRIGTALVITILPADAIIGETLPSMEANNLDELQKPEDVAQIEECEIAEQQIVIKSNPIVQAKKKISKCRSKISSKLSVKKMKRRRRGNHKRH